VTEQLQSKRKLRTGFTTGTCAAAASKAALLALVNQKTIDIVEVKLPKGNKLSIQIHSCVFNKKSSRCSVIKDGGDDPDVTHGAEIIVDLKITDVVNQVEIHGGEGIGTVTKPGLGLEIGKPAINPVPKKMVEENVREVSDIILKKSGIQLIISVPKGAEIALKTDNPRLGIVGGISILGTSGIVIPYSTASFAAAIRQSLDVTVAMGNDTVVLTTGGRSEDFAKPLFELPTHCFVQMGDFAGYSIEQCSKKGIKKAFVVGFIGKLAKMATGVKQTHVKGSKVNMNFLSIIAQKSGADEKTILEINEANSARHVLEIIKKVDIQNFFRQICSEVYKHMRNYSNENVSIEVILFDFDGKILARYPL